MTQQKAKGSSIENYNGLSRDKLPSILNEIEQARNRKIYGHKSMSKDRLLRIINNNNKKNENSLYDPTRDCLFKSKWNKIKRIFYTPLKKKPLKSKIKEIIKIIHNIKIKKDRKIEEIKKIFYESKKKKMTIINQ